MPPRIENAAVVPLDLESQRILLEIFSRYKKIVIYKEFSRGLSGGRVLEVRPVRLDGTPELPAVVKIAPIAMIEQEWAAYRKHVQHRLPSIAQVTSRPVMIPSVGLGGLRYAMMGEGTFEMISLRDYCLRGGSSAENIQTVIDRLLRIMRNIWGYKHLCPDFHPRFSYDSVLPVNLLVRADGVSFTDRPHRVTPASIGTLSILPGDKAIVSGFHIHKLNRELDAVTLRSPQTSAQEPSYFVRYRGPVDEHMAAMSNGQAFVSFAGEVLETRHSRLCDEVCRAFGAGFDPESPMITVGNQSLSNPLLAISHLLNWRRNVHLASIHGDFNLENVLVEPETGSISLIDFADGREDHVLHDLLRLESEVLTRLLPEFVRRHQLNPEAMLIDLFGALHRATFARDPDQYCPPMPSLHKLWAILCSVRRAARQYCEHPHDLSEYYHGLTLYLVGVLKFKNLNEGPDYPLNKRVALWAAALAFAYIEYPPSEPVLLSPVNSPHNDSSPQPEANQPAIPAADDTPYCSTGSGSNENVEPENKNSVIGGLDETLQSEILQSETLQGEILQSEILHRNRNLNGGTYPPQPTLNRSHKLQSLPLSPSALLAALPVETSSRHEPLPPRSRMPFERNPSFIGREAILHSCALFLRQETPVDQSAPVLTITAEGGMGKSQLASEVVHRFGHYFAGGVYWLSMADPRAVPTEVVACGRAMKLRPDFDNLPFDEKQRLVKEAWESEIPRLLVFDNCEDTELLRTWRPARGGCRVLLTSRNAEWQTVEGVTAMPLKALTRRESVNLLRGYRAETDQELLDTIAEEVGDLPLALHLAGSFLARYRAVVTPQAYLQELRSSALDHQSMISGEFSFTEHEQNISRTIAVSFNRLDQTRTNDWLALNLLAAATLLAWGEPIPLHLLQPFTRHSPSDSDVGETRLHLALGRLSELGLARLEKMEVIETTAPATGQIMPKLSEVIADPRPIVDPSQALRLHRLIAQFVQRTLAETIALLQPELEKTIGSQAERVNQSGMPVILLPWQAHLRVVTNRTFARKDELTARLYHASGEHFRQLGDFDRAKAALQVTLDVHRALKGNDHPITLQAQTELGFVLLHRQEWDEAKRLYEEALYKQQECLGDHPDTANTLNRLGVLHQWRGELESARLFHEQALAIRLKMLSADQTSSIDETSVAESLNNLAYTYYFAREHSDARRLMEQALEIQLRLHGEVHVVTAEMQNNLAEVLMMLNEFDGAYAMCMRSLQTRMSLLREDHPDIARIYHDLGNILRNQGDLLGSAHYMEKALKLRQDVLGEDHFYTGETWNDYGVSLQEAGKIELARNCYRRAYDILRLKLGENHRRTKESRLYLELLGGGS